MAQEDVAGLVVKLAMDSGSFQEGITSLNRQMKVIDSEFKAAVGNAKDFGSSLDGLTKNADRLNKSIAIQNDIVEKYRQKLDNSKITLENNIKAQIKLDEEIKTTTKAYNESVESLGKNAIETQKLKAKLDELQKSYDTNNEKIRNSEKAIDNNTIAFNKAEAKLNSFNRELEENSRAMSKTNKSADSNSSIFDKFAKSIGDNSKETSILGVKLSDLSGMFSKGGLAAGAMGGLVAGLTSKMIELAMTGIQIAIDKIKELIVKGIQLQSSLAEIENVFNTVFGENSNSVEEWVNKATESLGLSELQVKKFSSTFASAIQGIDGISEESMINMSKNITQLTSDFASFNNLKVDESFDKMMSIISGQTEPLQKFGINMNVATMEAYALSRGIDKTWQSMTEAEKVTLRYNYVLERTKNVHGDFAKTQESFANSTRSFQIAIDKLSMAFGGKLVDGLGEAIAGMSSFVESITPIIEFIGTLVGNIIKSVAVIINLVNIPLKAILGAINPIVEKVTSLFEYTNKKATEFTGTVKDAFSTTKDDLEYTYEEMKNSTDEAFGYMKKAVDKYTSDSLSKYEEELRKKFDGGTLREEKEIQKRLSFKEASLKRETEKYEEEEKKRLEISEKYYKKKMSMYEGTNNSSYIPKYASGTKYHPGGLAIVGEQGPELINLSRGAQVITNTQTQQILNNTSNQNMPITMNINVSSDDPQYFIQQIKSYIRRGGAFA